MLHKNLKVLGTRQNAPSTAMVAIFLNQKVEAPQHFAISHHEHRRVLACGAVADPIAMREAKNVLRCPVKNLTADSACSVSLNNDAYAVACTPIRNGLGVGVDFAHVTVEQPYCRSAGHWIDVADATRPVPRRRRRAQR